MSLKERITNDMKEAMRNKENARRDAIRLLTAAIKQREVDERRELADAEILAVIEKLCKQRRDSITQYEAAARTDLAAGEKFELDLLLTYLPQQMTESEIIAAIDAAVATLGIQGAQDMGKLMGQLKSSLAGKADMSLVSKLAKAKLAG